MKAVLHFNLDDTDDVMAHRRCVKATDMALALWDIREAINDALDTSEDGLTISGLRLQDAINEIMSHRSIMLDELII